MATSGKDLSAYDIKGLYLKPGTRIGICVSEWNEEITSGLLKGAIEVLDQRVAESDMIIHHVPGSFELPLAAQFLLESEQVEGVICIGSVIRGETAHFDYVCQAVSQGVMNLGLKYNSPCIFCVLTDDTIDQSRARSGGEHGNKGTEAAVAMLKMLSMKENVA